ncbi:MAG: CPBP family intramembrane glutamic endopeptidase [Rhodovibrionaceae bacterium]
MSVPQVQPGRRMPFGFWKLCLLLVAVIGLSLLGVPLVFKVVLQTLGGSEGAPVVALAAAMLTQTAIMFGVFYGLAIQLWGVTWRQVGLRPSSAVWYFRAVLLAILAMLLVALVSVAMESLLGGPIDNPQVGMLAPGGSSIFSAIVMLILVAGLAPLVEELLFRGLVYRWISERYGMWIALFFSALIFSCLHGIPALIPPLFVVGCLLAWLYEKSGSIWPCVAMHGVFNAMMLIGLYAGLAAGIEP